MSKNSVDAIPETFWAYFAGMIDGEGSIGLGKRERKYGIKTKITNQRQFNLSNMHLQTLEWIKNTCQMGHLHRSLIEKSEPPIYKYLLTFSGKESRVILPKLVPYLIQKKERANIMIEWLSLLSDDPHANNLPHLKRKGDEIYERFQIAQSSERYWKPKGERTVWHLRKKKGENEEINLTHYK